MNFLKKYSFIFLLLLVAGVSLFYFYQHQKYLNDTNVRVLIENGEVKADIKNAQSANKQLEKEIEVIEKSQELTQELTKEVIKEKEKDNKQYEQLQKQVQKQLDDINQRYDKLEKTKENEERRAIEISLERAKGLWLVYCFAQPEAKECQ